MKRTIVSATATTVLLPRILFGFFVVLFPSCRPPAPQSSGAESSRLRPVHLQVLGGWLAPRTGQPLDSAAGSTALQQMRALGVRTVAVGHDVHMPRIRAPKLEWGGDDAALRGILRRIKQAGMASFLLPRIESPSFFEPPFPFRADIGFDRPAAWATFHDHLERMVVHYAALAQAEGVALFGIGLELKHSVRGFPDRWRAIIARVRRVYRGKITYSANWYDEWRDIEFWDDLDYIGIGAYFELRGTVGAGRSTAGRTTVAELVRRWQPILHDIQQVAARFDKPVLFTEVGYTGYVDCAERPWEWAGKQAKSVAIDHRAQARAFAALCTVVERTECLAGMCVWRFYTDPQYIEPWEYAVQGRPAAKILQQFYRRPGK